MKHYEVYGHIPDIDTITWSYSTDILESSMYPALLFSGGNKGEIVSIQRGETVPIELLEPSDTMILMASYGLNNTALFPEIQLPRVPYVGAATLYATIKNGDETYQMQKEIVLPEYTEPSVSQGSSLWLVNTERTLYETSCNGIDPEYIKWYIRYPDSDTEQEYTGHSVTLKPTQKGKMTVRVVNDCGCEGSKETTYTYSVGQVRPLSYPNPNTAPIFPIDLEIEQFGQMDGFYTIEMWHEQYGRVKSVTLLDTHVDIDVSDLPMGWYQIVLRHGDTILDSGNIFIRH
jgi:hypothetical protein